MTLIQRLLHRLLGWHYAAVEFGGSHSVARVFKDGDGRPYVRVCYTHIDLQTTHRDWHPLTFPRDAVRIEVREPKFTVISA